MRTPIILLNLFLWLSLCGIGNAVASSANKSGIVSVNPTTYQTQTILLQDTTSYGTISGMAIISATKGYFVGYAGWGDNTLYSFNPSTGGDIQAVQGLEHKNIGGFENGIALDKNGMLWVCNQSDNEVDVLNTATDIIDEKISTSQMPQKVAFVDNAGVQSAVVATAAPDYTSGAISIISVDPVGGPRTVDNNLDATGSDISVVAYGQYFYVIGRSSLNNIAKYDIQSPSTLIWEYSTEGDEHNSNPQQLIFLNDHKAYLTRLGSDKVWIVDPSTTTEAGFKTGEIDLSAYVDQNDGDHLPEAHSGVIVGGNLFITLQRVDLSKSYGNFVYYTPEVIVINTSNNNTIDVISIPDIKNPWGTEYVASTNMIYIQGAGDWGAPDSTTSTGDTNSTNSSSGGGCFISTCR